MLDLHQGFSGRELSLGPYVKLGLQQMTVLMRLFKGEVLEAGGLQLATVTELGKQVTLDLTETARRVLEATGVVSPRVAKPSPAGQATAREAEPAAAGPRPAFTAETAHVVPRAAPAAAIEVAAHTVQERLKAGEEVVFVDVRESIETLGGVIPGARLIPLDQVPGRAKDLSGEGKPILLYCASGSRSRVAAPQLAGLGLADVASIRGGIRSWAQAGGDITLPPRKG
jgi:rhodanese-related sulfurtransferase